MSKNYYWKMDLKPATWTNPMGDVKTVVPDQEDPIIHIAQHASTYRGSTWTWAQDPQKVRAYCEAHPNEIAIVDEYGIEYKCAEFLQHLSGGVHDTHLIGKWFC